jgi:Domain of unknown function (DUF4968)
MHRQRLTCALFVTFGAVTTLVAADSTVTRDERGVTLTTANGAVRVEVDQNRQFQVLAGPAAPLAVRQSYVVSAIFPVVPFTVHDDEKVVELATTAVRARMNRTTGAVTLGDTSGSPFTSVD